MHQHHISSWV